MRREEMADLTAFMAVAQERSFTRAAVKLGMTQSALSQIIRRLEERLGLRLLSRTTRSVAATEAGERLMHTLVPALEELDVSLAALSSQRGTPHGTVRITSVEHATETVLWPALRKLIAAHPHIRAEVTSDYDLTDIVAEGFDAGVRLGEDVDKDMIAVRIGPDLEMTVVGAPLYFTSHPKPLLPQDLVNHECINLKLSPSRGNWAWPFIRGKRELKVRVNGPFGFNAIAMSRQAALEGIGLAYLPKDYVATYLRDGQLISVLREWCPKLPGYHLYYPSRRQLAPAFSLLIEVLRYQKSKGKMV